MSVPTDDLEFSTTLAGAQTLTEAARHWGVSVASVSRRLQALEARLGVALVTRRPRGLELTPEGQQYRRHGTEILQQVRDLEAALNPDPHALTGRIRLISTVGLGRMHLAPILHEFQRDHPGVELELELSSEPLGASMPGFDVAVRVGEVPDSTLVMHRLAENRRVLVASPRYLGEHGTPQNVEDLRFHRCLRVRENERDSNWDFLVEGRTVSVSVSGTLSCNDGLAVTDWCRAGAGIAMRSTWHVGPMISSGELVHVLPHVETPQANILALTERSVYTPPSNTCPPDAYAERAPPAPCVRTVGELVSGQQVTPTGTLPGWW